MKTNMLKLIPVVAAVAALSFSAGAFAGGNGYGDDNHHDNNKKEDTDVNIEKDISYNQKTDVNEKIDVHGNFTVDSKALAVNDNNQSRGKLTTHNFRHKNDVIIDGNAFNNASGLASVNVAGGTANQQNNGLALSVETTTTGHELLDAENFNKQSAKKIKTDDGFINNNAKIEGQAFSHFHGIASVNVAAGEGNQQNNGVAIAVGNGVANTATNTSKQKLGNVKVTNNDDLEDSYCPYISPLPNNYGNGAVSQNFATIGGDAFSNAAGVMAVNVASGIGNQQNNGLAVTTNLSH
jgi:hypothetical protein